MLNISKPLSSGRAQTCHAKEFTSAEQLLEQNGAILGKCHGNVSAGQKRAETPARNNW
jgi:hypothetical protein